LIEYGLAGNCLSFIFGLPNKACSLVGQVAPQALPDFFFEHIFAWVGPPQDTDFY
jgi:hypothetical protein